MFHKKTPFAIALIFFGALFGALAVVGMIFAEHSIVIALLFALSLGSIVLGSMLGLTDLLDRSAKPIVQELKEDLEDDARNIREGNMTWPIFQSLLTVVAALVYILLLLRYHKFEAVWWDWMPVWVPTGLVIFLMIWIVSRTDWFNDRYFETPWWVYLIAITGFGLAMLFGINKTEDTRLLSLAAAASDTSYNSNIYRFYSLGGEYIVDIGVNSIDVPDCSGDSCDAYLYLILFIVFVALVFILVIGSALLPHFWVLAGGLFITMMIIISTQRLLVRESGRSRY